MSMSYWIHVLLQTWCLHTLTNGLLLKSERTKKVVTVANDNKSDVLGKVMDVPELFEQLEARIDYLVLKNDMFDLLSSEEL